MLKCVTRRCAPEFQIEPNVPFRLDLTAWALRRRSHFPGPEQLASLEPDDLRRHGFSITKSLDDDAAVERLVHVPGIGRWSAEYVLLRSLRRVHVFPGGC